ncbi:hypothetical protein [Cellulosimicrobium cellulans]|uniref:hypothetical protein n=1 Tax=Cellulosimicrobium cellulans TaxID=1710 RepID=UPI001BAB578A|nr:hypothetical protein [Cellulosimicrobium cellulans]QUC01226.1 hypothetical protein J5A69_08715 [Cellulosimicrobium cellulans]
MSVVVRERAFEVAGVGFGTRPGDLVLVRSFEPGTQDLENQDAANPVGDGVLVGRDRARATTWSWELFTNERDEPSARAAVAPLAAAWRSATALPPGELMTLRYFVAGRWRRVYGRPRRWAPPVSGPALAAGRADVVCDFRVTDPLHYDDDEQTVTLQIVPPTTGGLLAPLVAPLSTARSSAPAARFITVRGDAPAPVRVTFHGPVKDPWVRGTGWEVGLVGSIAYDGRVVVDTRTTTVLRADGASVAGMLSRRTRLAELRLAPGPHELTFGGIDPTGTAAATVAWRDAHYSL